MWQQAQRITVKLQPVKIFFSKGLLRFRLRIVLFTCLGSFLRYFMFYAHGLIDLPEKFLQRLQPAFSPEPEQHDDAYDKHHAQDNEVAPVPFQFRHKFEIHTP